MITEIQIMIGIACLSYASRSDMKTRTVSNKVWSVMIISGGLTNGYLMYSGVLNPLSLVIVLGLSVLIGGFLYHGGFGGADTKALMSIAFLLPLYPGSSLLRDIMFIKTLLVMFILALAIIPISKFEIIPIDDWKEDYFPMMPFLLIGFVISLLV